MPLRLKIETEDHKPADPDERETVDRIVTDCAGDQREAILCLLRLTAQLVRQNEHLAAVVFADCFRRPIRGT